jgi:integrase
MAWTEPYKKGHRGRYEVKDEVTGKVRKITAGWAPTKKAAEQLAQAEELKILGGTWIDPAKSKVTFAEYFEKVWWPNCHLSSRDGIRSDYDCHLAPRFGHMELRRITATSVQAFITDLIEAEKAPATIVKIHIRLQSILGRRKGSSAVRDGYIARNPCEGTELPYIVPPEVKIYEPDEINDVIDEMDPWWQPLPELWKVTGMRWNELMGLQVEDFSLGMRSVMITRVVNEKGKKWTDDGTPFLRKPFPKTKKPREVWLSRQTGQMIAELIQARGLQPGDRIFSMPEKKAEHGTGRVLSTLPERTLAWPEGYPVPRSHFRKYVWAKAHAKAEVKALKPYALRATNISWMLDGGAELPAVMELVGHTKSETTKRYTKARRVNTQGLDALAKVEAEGRRGGRRAI